MSARTIDHSKRFSDFDSSAYLDAIVGVPEEAAQRNQDAQTHEELTTPGEAAQSEWLFPESEPLVIDEVELLPAVSEEKLEVHADAALIQSIAAIPDKMAFKIGEAAEMIGVKQYVLRYWETEFDQLRPKKSKNNQRVFSHRDVQTALMIKKLLYVDRFSIEGARAALRPLKRDVRGEKEIIAVVSAHEAAIKGVRALLARIDQARARFAEII